MLWSKFKEIVDNEIKKAGLDDSEIFYIDVHLPDEGRFDVGFDDDLGLVID